MLIGVCGLGWTGSGAVKDLLKEYNETNNIFADQDYEFNIVYKTDGILDLKYHLFDGSCRDISSLNAINRFINLIKDECSFNARLQKMTKGEFKRLSTIYIKNITQIEWDYFCLRDYQCGNFLNRLQGKIMWKCQREFDKRFKSFIPAFPLKKCYFSVRPHDFDMHSQNYIMGIIESLTDDKDKIMVLDQPFPGDNPVRCFPYFNDPYAIVVDRDPRDLYIMMKYICKFEGNMLKQVDDFIIYYKQIRKNCNYDPNHRVLRIQFEDLVYQYDETVKRIEQFLHIQEHIKKNMFFKPGVSIQNTQLWEKYPNEKINIEKIENELRPWLYNSYTHYTATKHRIF